MFQDFDSRFEYLDVIMLANNVDYPTKKKSTLESTTSPFDSFSCKFTICFKSIWTPLTDFFMSILLWLSVTLLITSSQTLQEPDLLRFFVLWHSFWLHFILDLFYLKLGFLLLANLLKLMLMKIFQHNYWSESRRTQGSEFLHQNYIDPQRWKMQQQNIGGLPTQKLFF